MAAIHEHYPDLAATADQFLDTFDVDWARDIPMILQLMLIVVFNPRRSALQQPHVVAEIQLKWLDRLRRYLLNRHGPNRTGKALNMFKAALTQLHVMGDVEPMGIEQIQQYYADAITMNLMPQQSGVELLRRSQFH